jgi:DNA-binding PadR family transcriptional regulator
MTEPSYGYELQRTLTRLSHFYPLRNVNVYPVLSELEEEGYARSESKVVAERLRRVYTITDRGREAFDEWMASQPEASLPEVRDPIHLRLVLAADHDIALPWLKASIGEVEAEVAKVRARYDKSRKTMTPLARLVIDDLLESLERRRAFLLRAEALQAPRR